MARVPSGTVTFLDGTTNIGLAMLNASGAATFVTTSLSVGVHSLTAPYPASALFLGSTSPPYSETVLPNAFTIALAPGTLTVASGKSATATINLASVGKFAGPLTLTHGALPANAMGSISPSVVTLAAGGTATSTITLSPLSVAANAMPSRSGSRGTWVIPRAVFLLLPLVRRRKRVAKALLLVTAATLAQGLIGCGYAFHIAQPVVTGTYNIPVTATDTNGNAQTANLTVVVTP